MSAEAGQMFIQLIKQVTSATKKGDIQWRNRPEYAGTTYKGVFLSFSHVTQLFIVHTGGGITRSDLPPSYRQEINKQSKLLDDAIVAQTDVPESEEARYTRALGALLDKPEEEEPLSKDQWWHSKISNYIFWASCLAPIVIALLIIMGKI